ncbi:phosphoenolpyruvate--protein phosphotransferase [Endozoicomonas arenosclerae]|uniref:phosphoenolpyruvate--protein phosphotransferase n=1 Tax=Endozoicomonas arenosclerae TaxID=1633495 RepID=UPI0007864D57|nr:phosphoenolpyruvate--protein phosphotransferase [Endozoicomonas arenosclerae]
MNSSASFNYTFPLPNGLHARPASFIEEAVKSYSDSITITNLRNNKEADARSVLSMIASDIALDDPILVKVTGEKAESTLNEFKIFLETEFLTCDEPLAVVENKQQKPLPHMLRSEELQSLRGVSVSPGIARGVPLVLGEPRLTLNPETQDKAEVTEELARFDEARQHLKAQLEHQAETSAGEEKAILKAHLSLLCDEKLVSSISEGITGGLSILSAILKTQEHFTQVLESSSSEYLQERALDIRDLCSKLIVETYGEDSFEKTDCQLMADTVCIASSLAPSQFLSLDRSFLKGLVLEAGGTTSHTVILARSFGIPVMVGVEGARSLAAGGNQVIMDANLGLLVSNPSENVGRFYDLEQSKQERLSQRREKYIDQTAVTLDGHRIEVAANIASAEEAEAAFAQGAEGVGLFRTEMLYMDRTEPPCEEEQFEIYRKALTSANGKPVIIRTMDIGGDKPVDYFNIGNEENPFLGYRAVRLYPEYLNLFHTQLRAILRASQYGQCKIMVPMVATLAEAKWLREVFNSVVEALKVEGVEHNPDVQLGIMLEVPSCAFIIDQLVRYVDFFSIGSNDLTQYLLAADRGNSKVEHLYDSLNPAFLRLLKHVVSEAHKAGAWVGMCGEFAGSPEHLPVLLGLGLDEVSLSAPRILELKEAISQLTLEDSKQILEQALQLETSEEVAELLKGASQKKEAMPILAEHSIIMNADCRSKAEVIKTLVDNLDVNGRASDVFGAEEAIWDREAISPTMLGFGIAIPHCKSDSIAVNSISIMKLAEPILWNEGDQVMTDTVFMLTVRASEAGSVHMQIFAQLARRIMRGAFRDSLAACTSEQELLEFISSELEL